MDHPETTISNNLKRVREERNLSYTQLADMTGVSKSMLRQIEVGESSPTINTLWKIANGLGIPFTMLIDPPHPRLTKINFKGRDPILGMTEGYRLFPLVTFETTRNFELYYIEMDPGVSLDADPHTGSTEEINMVIQGTLQIRVRQETAHVYSGEMLRFDANHPHHYHNAGTEMVKAFIIITYRG